MIKPEVEAALVGEEGQDFVPQKYWTSWPLRPEDVPRAGEHVGPEDPDEIYTLKKREKERPSRELEEVLMGVTLKFAKERFEARQWEQYGKDKELTNVDGNEGERPSAATEDVANSSAGAAEDLEDNSMIQDNDEFQETIKQQSESPPPRSQLRPVVSADDERSRKLLRPSIRHTLSKLDETLMALHHAREACLRYEYQRDPDSEDEIRENNPVDETTIPVKRRQGRQRKKDLPNRPKIDVDSLDKNPNDSGTKKSRRGRPKKQYDRLEGETHEEYYTRVARIQKKPLPDFGRPEEVMAPKEKTPEPTPRGTRVVWRTVEERKFEREKRLGLRGWSEVMGSAALVGFPPDVIARATQRCATLFGESMSMRTLLETPSSQKDIGSVMNYQPEIIPAFDPEVGTLEESDEESDGSDSVKPGRSGNFPEKPKRDPTRRKSCLCPISGCYRKRNGFQFMSNLHKHLHDFHEMPEDEVEELCPPSDEEMDGAVHVDGFLRPVKQHMRRVRRKKNSKEGDTSMRERHEEGKEHGEDEDSSDQSESESEPDQSSEDNSSSSS